MAENYRKVLVTGGTGFIGAHVVDALLERGCMVKVATRDTNKAAVMAEARKEKASQLQFIQIADFSQESTLADAVNGVDGVIHVASPFSYNVKSNEKELVLPAIQGVKAVMTAASREASVKRVVLTSSFASVMNAGRKAPPRFTYTEKDWNPLSYEESINPATSAVIAYRGSKKFAELEAWNFIRDNKPHFDLVTLCPPMTFGPTRHPVARASELNESNAMLWQVASGRELPVARVPFWIDVRDLARAHVEALFRPHAGNQRYTVAAPEKFSYPLAAGIITKQFDWAKVRVQSGDQSLDIDDSYDLDGDKAAKELGVTYKTFKDTVVDLIAQITKLEKEGG